MRKLIVLLVLLILFAAAAVALAPYLIGTETFKQRLVEKLSRETGYDIAIGGAIQVRIFPSLGARLENIAVRNMPDNGSLPVLKAQSIAVDVALLPLLRKEIEITSLLLKDPEITLYTTSAGRTNWRPETAAPAPGGADAPPAESAAAMPDNFMVSDIGIENGTLVYNNEQAKQLWTLKKLNLNVALGKEMRLTLKGGGEWNDQPLKADVSIDTLLRLLGGQSAKIKGEIKGNLATLSVDGAWDKDFYTGKLDGKILSIKDFKAWVSPGGKPMTQELPSFFAIAGDAQCSAVSCHIANAALKLDTLKAGGDVKAMWAAGNAPQLDLALKTDRLDLNLFLPAEKIEVSRGSLISPAMAAAEDSGWSTDPIDFSPLSALDANVTIQADSMAMRNITAANAAISAKLQRGRLSFTMQDADFYSGKLSVAANLEPIGKAMTWDGHWLLKDVQIAPFLKDALDEERLSGVLNLNMDTERSGNSMYELIYGVSGTGSIKITDGAFKGFNVAEMARNIQAAFQPRTDTGGQKTDFSEMSGTFTIIQGLVSTNDLSMKSPFLRVTGNGEINLPEHTLNLRLLPQFVDTAQGQGGKDKQAMAAVPILVSGPLDSPTFAPDVQSIAKDAIQNPDKLKKQLKGAKDAVKGLLKKF